MSENSLFSVSRLFDYQSGRLARSTVHANEWTFVPYRFSSLSPGLADPSQCFISTNVAGSNFHWLFPMDIVVWKLSALDGYEYLAIDCVIVSLIEDDSDSVSHCKSCAIITDQIHQTNSKMKRLVDHKKALFSSIFMHLFHSFSSVWPDIWRDDFATNKPTVYFKRYK